MKTVTLKSGECVPALGQGTWRMGEDSRRRSEEVRALKTGLDCGMTLIDTAEMYGSGRAEEIVGEAVAGRRDEVFIVSKVYPHNATRRGAIQACERSLQRLGTDRIDLYLLHWRGSTPLAETLEAFQVLADEGKVRHYGVSNLDAGEMETVNGLAGGDTVAVDQVLYNLTRRGIEWDLLPWCRDHDVAVMAYSPFEQGRLGRTRGLSSVARRHGVSEYQVALAWVLRHDAMIAIPKAVQPDHIRENAAAGDIALSAEDLAQLDWAYPPPKAASPLPVL